MLHSSVCISSAPTSWLVVRHARTHARMQRTADGLITDCRKLQIHEPKESVLAKSGCAAERSCSLRCEYRRIIDSRVTIMVSQTLPQKPWSLKKKNKTWFLVYQTDFGDDKLSGNERRITRTWFIHFEKFLFQNQLAHNSLHYSALLSSDPADAHLPNILTAENSKLFLLNRS